MIINSIKSVSRDSSSESNYIHSISPDGNPTIIKVIGVGGGGGNAINCMINNEVENVQFITVNTDIQALQMSDAPAKRALGTKLTGGLGAGGDPEIGKQAALEDREAIKELVSGADMVFITAGMGGGTGTGAAPIIAEVAKEMDILTVAVVTFPFRNEGKKKRQIAENGIAQIREAADTLIVIHNEHLLDLSKEKRLLMSEAFDMANNVLSQGVCSISEIITKTGQMNVDFADVKTIMCGKGDAIMGVGIGNGDQRVLDAATTAINNPLLRDVCIDGAKDILINVTSDAGLAMDEFNEIIEIITAKCDDDAMRINGWIVDEGMSEEVKVTVIATGFNNRERVSKSDHEDISAPTADQKEETYVSLDEFMKFSQGDDMLFNVNPPEESETSYTHKQTLQVPTIMRRSKRGGYAKKEE